MARHDNRYSRFVAYVKLLLPLLALGLLSTLFLVPAGPGRDAAQDILREDLDALIASRLLRAPVYSSVTEDGGNLTVTAETATPRPGESDLYDFSGLAVTLDAADDGRTTLLAESGIVDSRAQEGTFVGDVRITTPDAYLLTTERLFATLDGSVAESRAAVRVTGPRLSIDAGRMALAEGSAGTAGGHVLFNEGVRLIYTPQREEPVE
jgi:lipopolysaccharide export system protein LptC